MELESSDMPHVARFGLLELAIGTSRCRLTDSPESLSCFAWNITVPL